MNLPNGNRRNNIDPLIFFNIWAHHLDRYETSYKKMIFAGIGKPSYVLNEDIISSMLDYWGTQNTKVKTLNAKIAQAAQNPEELCDLISIEPTSIDYEVPGGNPEAQAIMAQAMSRWYGVPISSEEIIFTVGGMSALRMIFRLANEKNPHGKIVTTSPYYPFYNNTCHRNNLSLINILDLPNYKLTAEILQTHINLLNQQNTSINAFLFCDPHNPLGVVFGESELHEIAAVLKDSSPDIPIILDEAYAELVFSGKHISLLTVAPELKERIIILRSATKALSASGERMAIMICSQTTWSDTLLIDTVATYVHSPKSLQVAYAHALDNFTPQKLQTITNHYKLQVEVAQKKLTELDIQVPGHTVEATFYIIANLSSLLGTIAPASIQRAVGPKTILETDEDIAFTLLFEDRVMVTPLSYFGADPRLGYLRITCSAGPKGICELIDRMAARLKSHQSTSERYTSHAHQF